MIDYLDHEKEHWLYNEETDELDRVTPHIPSPIDFGNPNAHRLLGLLAKIGLVVWFIAIYKAL